MPEDFLDRNYAHQHEFFGLYWGVIEQRIDPERRQRVRVRVYGIHNPSIKTEHLPWALPCTPAWWQGGKFGVPPLGSTVGVLFEAGNYERPVYFGGHWGAPSQQLETPQGKAGTGSAHHERATSAFGGKKIRKEHSFKQKKSLV